VEAGTRGLDGRCTWASDMGHEAVVRLLLDKGADVKREDG
jgi:hypothetical protein